MSRCGFNKFVFSPGRWEKCLTLVTRWHRATVTKLVSNELLSSIVAESIGSCEIGYTFIVSWAVFTETTVPFGARVITSAGFGWFCFPTNCEFIKNFVLKAICMAASHSFQTLTWKRSFPAVVLCFSVQERERKLWHRDECTRSTGT